MRRKPVPGESQHEGTNLIQRSEIEYKNEEVELRGATKRFGDEYAPVAATYIAGLEGSDCSQISSLQESVNDATEEKPGDEKEGKSKLNRAMRHCMMYPSTFRNDCIIATAVGAAGAIAYLVLGGVIVTRNPEVLGAIYA